MCKCIQQKLKLKKIIGLGLLTMLSKVALFMKLAENVRVAKKAF